MVIRNVTELSEDDEFAIIQIRLQKLIIIFPLLILSYPFRLLYWKMKEMIKEWYFEG